MDNIDFFAELLQCIHDIHLWVYDRDGLLIRTTIPQETYLSEELFRDHNTLIREAAWKHSRPSILSSRLETTWIIDSTRVNGEPEFIFAFVPFFIDTMPKKTIEQKIEEINLSLSGKHRLLDMLKSLPVIPFTRVIEYAIMMHYTLTSEKINTYDLHIRHHEYVDPDNAFADETKVHGTYDYELELLRRVREGDLGLIDFMKKNSKSLVVGKLATDDSDSLRQLKNTILVAITLFSRAAIDGGLYPDTAMTLTDHYFQAVEAAKSFQEIVNINLVMQTDFVNRVHKIRTDKSCSKTIRMVKEYIDLHKEDEIKLKDIAREFGYTEYYLTKKFHNETGTTIKEYIRDVRLEYSKYLLKHEKEPVREISDRLRFTSQSYFTDCFRKKYGMTPNEYRQAD